MCTSTIRTYKCGCVYDECTTRCPESHTNPASTTDQESCPGVVVERIGVVDGSCEECARLEEEPVEVYSDGAVSESDAADVTYEHLNSPAAGPNTVPYASGMWERERLVMYDFKDWVKSRTGREGHGKMQQQQQGGNAGRGNSPPQPPPPPPSDDGLDDDDDKQ
ncbi:hypothetical protein BO82DRAFT_429429 [Aspergillus uvarum CBS 121591]|uniref:Uncharacterized protein n=1 Tax=Aspergillus uvarum CBS 121591 TaxID=1448315 RepID=A0A319DBJ2_9EURO|nr:hypothetical protein BO82DRAFT_429429 [Aspergillus uvarum CBS 121591]PYH85438.1 hypothetical protein BO82DRAFT_429429 [Aspergillus uvarum CBS 121591]